MASLIFPLRGIDVSLFSQSTPYGSLGPPKPIQKFLNVSIGLKLRYTATSPTGLPSQKVVGGYDRSVSIRNFYQNVS